MPWKALVVDDEAPAREFLKDLLEECGGLTVVGEAATGDGALEAVRRLQPEVVFLDIQMPGRDGLSVAGELLEWEDPPYLVFVTAYDQYAVQAFELEAVDYLLKPVEPSRLKRTVEKLGRQDEREETFTRLLRAVDRLQGKPMDRLALLDERSGVRMVVKLDQVGWITSRQEKTYVFVQGRELRCMDTMAGLEERLSEDFMRTHRSFIVNLARVREVAPWGNGAYNVKLEDSDQEIPLSRHYAPRFKARVGWI